MRRKQMKAIKMREEGGFYEFAPNASEEDWETVLQAFGPDAEVTKVDTLLGWGAWEAAMRIDHPDQCSAYYFVRP